MATSPAMNFLRAPRVAKTNFLQARTPPVSNSERAPTPGYRGILGLSAGVVRVSGLSARIDPPPPNFGGPLPNALCDRRQ